MSDVQNFQDGIAMEGNCSLTITSTRAGGGLLDFAGYANVRDMCSRVQFGTNFDIFLEATNANIITAKMITAKIITAEMITYFSTHS